MESRVLIKIEASKDSGHQMTLQGTMWNLHSKSQLEEETPVLQSQGMEDLLFEKIILLCTPRYKKYD